MYPAIYDNDAINLDFMGNQGREYCLNKYNTKAIRCYAVFGFRMVGECRMYEQDFLCYEREL